jgi:hypothetical protein
MTKVGLVYQNHEKAYGSYFTPSFLVVAFGVAQ